MKKIMLFFAVACIMAACNNDNEVLNETQYVTEFKADFGGVDSRMTAEGTNTGLKFAWEDGELLYVLQANDATVNYLTYVFDETTGTFKALYDGYAMIVGKKYFAVNRTRNFAEPFTIEDGKIVFKAKLENDKGIEKIQLISDVFTAQASGTIAAMHHTVGVVEVPVKLNAGSSLNVLYQVGFFVSGGKIALDFNATPESPYFIAPAETGTYDTTWSEGKETTLNENTPVSFYVPMFPGTYSNPTLYYIYGENTKGIDLNGTLTVECGKVTKMPEQTLTLN